MPDLRTAAESVLRSNDRGRFTAPAPHLYPHQWAWDSALAAIGWAHIDIDRATVELETLMAGVWDDGRLPHIQFAQTKEPYFPGPEFWGTEHSTSITQPPVQAIAARRLLASGADTVRIAKLLPAIERSHAWFVSARDPLSIGAVAVAHPWESGLDNCPAWDGAMARVDTSDVPPFRRVDKDRVDDPEERPPDEDYLRYAAIVTAIARSDFGPGPFAVYDPLITAILAAAERDLMWLAAQLDVETNAPDRVTRLLGGLERMWNDELGRYAYQDVFDSTLQAIANDTIGCYMPLIVEGLRAERAEILRAGLEQRYLARCEFPVPSTAPDDAAFEPRRYWRGPTWLNINWFLGPHLGDEVVESTLALVERSGFREYYDCRNGDGLGAREFTWSAALALDLHATAARPERGV